MKKPKLLNEILKRSSPAKPGKRFASYFIDFLLVTMVSYLAFLVAQPIAQNLPQYQNAHQKVKEEIAYYAELSAESHIVEYIDEDKKIRKDADILVMENCNRAIYLSYLTFGNSQQPEFDIEKHEQVKKYGAASVDSDPIAYYYTQYIPPRNANNAFVDMNGKTPIAYLQNVYRYAFGENHIIFTFDQTLQAIPVLNTQSAYYLFHYLYESDQDTIGKTGEAYYNAFYSAYSYMLSEAERSLILSEPYFSEHYQIYQTQSYIQAKILNVALLLSIVVGYGVAIVLAKLFLKQGRTIGRLALGMAELQMENEGKPWLTLTGKTITGFIGFLTTTMILYMFPPFFGVYDSMFMPLFQIGNTEILLMTLNIFIAGLAAINNVFILFTHDKKALLDILLCVKVMDTKRLDEGDRDEPEEGRPY